MRANRGGRQGGKDTAGVPRVCAPCSLGEGVVGPQATLCRVCSLEATAPGIRVFRLWAPSLGGLRAGQPGGGGTAGDCRVGPGCCGNEMKGQEWGCWQTDRRAGVGWGEGEITICKACQV